MYLDNLVVLVPRQKTPGHTVRALKVSPDTVRASRHFRLFEEDDTADSVQRDGVPDQLQTVLVPFLRIRLSLQERPRSISAIDLEPLVLAQHLAVWRVSDREAEIMKYSSDGVSFAVPIFALGDFVGDGGAE